MQSEQRLATHTANMRSGPEPDVAAGESDQLGDTQARLQHQHEDRAVAPPVPCREIRSRNDGFDLVAVEIVNRPFLVPLCRHGEHALAVMEQLRRVDSDILEERANCREASVAAACPVTPRLLKIGEEVGDEICVDIGDLQCRRVLLPLIGGLAEQQTERVAVARDRIRAGLHLSTEPLGEEPLQGR